MASAAGCSKLWAAVEVACAMTRPVTVGVHLKSLRANAGRVELLRALTTATESATESGSTRTAGEWEEWARARDIPIAACAAPSKGQH